MGKDCKIKGWENKDGKMKPILEEKEEKKKKKGEKKDDEEDE